MQQTWIEGVLERSLHQAGLITLNLEEQPEALVNPWRIEVQETNQNPHPLPPGTSIVQVYDEADGELLLLGEPGSGKTTLLLELARTLLERAEKNERTQLPVIFHLTSWTPKHKPIEKWLVDELWTKYQVPRSIGQSWVDSNQILPLLDGLDEVSRDLRELCVQAINTYYEHRLQEKGTAPMVMCCRSQEYAALSTHVTLQKAISILPLTDEHITRFLQRAQGHLEGLQYALHHDPRLRQMAHSPLMLTIFTVAYQDTEIEDLPAEGAFEALQQQVFATYVNQVLTRRGISKRFSQKQTRQWLTSLAVGMQQQQQTVFYPEQLQPYWLRNAWRRLLYRLSIGLVGMGLVYWLVIGPITLLVTHLPGLLYGLIIPSFFGLLCSLIFGWSKIQPREVSIQSWRKAKQSIIVGLISGSFSGVAFGLLVLLIAQLFQDKGMSAIWLVCGFIFGLGIGLIAGLIAGLATHQHDAFQQQPPHRNIWTTLLQRLINGIAGGLLVGLIVGSLFYLMLTLLSNSSVDPALGILGGLIAGLGSFPAFVFSQVHLRKIVTRSWKSTQQSALVGLSTGLTFGLLAGILRGSSFIFEGKWLLGLSFGLGNGLLAGVLFGLASGILHGLFAPKQLDHRTARLPNQGIWSSLYTGLTGWLSAGFTMGLVNLLEGGWISGFVYGLATGLIFGLIAGQGTFFQHFTLRFWLWRSNNLPWNIVPFLEEATQRLLLRKAGTGYLFIHRLLLDYFASLEQKDV